ncbi:MAG: porin family protein [Holophagaceae bacterium]|nr:porin family protein [Holophagaceae bacterium]
MTYIIPKVRAISLGFFAALAVFAPLNATDSGLRFGGGVSLVNPTGGLSDVSKVGFGVSAFAELARGGGTAFRGRLEYASFSKKEWDWTLKSSANSIVVMADWIFNFNTQEEGLYAFVGGGFLNNSLKVEFLGASGSASEFVFGLSGGGGFNFTRNFGVEVIYTRAFGKTSSTGEVAGTGFDWLQASFKFRL